MSVMSNQITRRLLQKTAGQAASGSYQLLATNPTVPIPVKKGWIIRWEIVPLTPMTDEQVNGFFEITSPSICTVSSDGLAHSTFLLVDSNKVAMEVEILKDGELSLGAQGFQAEISVFQVVSGEIPWIWIVVILGGAALASVAYLYIKQRVIGYKVVR